MSDQTAKLEAIDDQGNVFDSVTFKVVDGTNPHELSTKHAVRSTRIVSIRVVLLDGSVAPIDVGPNEDEGDDLWTSPLAGLPYTLSAGVALVVPPRALKFGLDSVDETELTSV